MDATVEEIFVTGGGSEAEARRATRAAKSTAKAQKNIQAAASKTGTSKNAGAEKMAAGNNDRGNAIEGSQATASAARSNGGRAQTVLRTMLQETSSHLMSEQKQMLERLWGALMENQNKATKVMSNQLETFGRLEQEIRSIRAEAAEDRKKTEELRRMHEQTADELRAVREETAGQLRQMREQMNGQLGQARQQTERKRSQAPSERQRRRWRKQRLASLRLGNVMLKPAPDSTSTFTLYQKHIHSQVSGRQEAGDTCHR
ncbi:hypothetical protein ACJZ2D_015467 [Fusarium nematophilum]